MFNQKEAECHQFIPRPDGTIRMNQRFYEVFRSSNPPARSSEHKYCFTGSKASHSPQHSVLRFTFITLASNCGRILQSGNQYAMLEDDIAATKRTVASMFDSRHDGSSRGKRGRDG